MDDGFRQPTDAVGRAVAATCEAVAQAEAARRTMVGAVRALAAAHPGTDLARRAEELSAAWEADLATWAAAVDRFGAWMASAADGTQAVDEALARSFGSP